METVLIVLGSVILLTLIVVIFLLIRNKPNQAPLQDIVAKLQQDQERRYQESESLRKELRDTSNSLREEFSRVNKTVDTKLSESSKQLNERLDKSSHVIGNLQKELGKMGEIGSKIENLDKILRAPKGRGSMGEESLEEILRSVFPPNLWERQYNLGAGMTVDAVVKTTNGLLPIDAKFPLPAFERIVNAENPGELEEAQKEFQRDVKKRIDEVSKYVRPEANTMNFAILFLPNENIYYEAAIRSGTLKEYGDSKKVLLTGPNTMLYVLQMLFQAYQSQEFAAQAKEALAQLSGIKSQAGKLEEGLEILEKHIRNANSKVGDVRADNQKLQIQIDQTVSLKGEKEQGTLL